MNVFNWIIHAYFLVTENKTIMKRSVFLSWWCSQIKVRHLRLLPVVLKVLILLFSNVWSWYIFSVCLSFNAVFAIIATCTNQNTLNISLPKAIHLEQRECQKKEKNIIFQEHYLKCIEIVHVTFISSAESRRVKIYVDRWYGNRIMLFMIFYCMNHPSLLFLPPCICLLHV